MTISKRDSSTRIVSLVRRIGSILVVSTIFTLLISDVYHRIQDRLWISDLRNIYKNGVSKLAMVEKEYEIEAFNDNQHLTFSYSFSEDDKTYENKYTLHQFLPQEASVLNRIFTVHYLKENPNKNTLNIEDEISRVETEIDESSFFWLIVKCIVGLILGLILFYQIVSLISEIRNVNKPIEIPHYLQSDLTVKLMAYNIL